MPYENFKSKNPLAAKIAANARKFGIETLQNEAVVSSLLQVQKINLTSEQRQVAAEIFTKLIQIEEDSQLSK
nr:acetyltransferase [uncultured Campylobacter sp.]